MTTQLRTGFAWTPRAIVAFCIIAVGLILTAGNLGLLNARETLRFWPLVIVVVGVVKGAQATARSSQLFGGFIVLVGLWLLADQFDALRFYFRDWWPLLLIVGGILLLSKGTRFEASPVVVAEPGATAIAFWSGVKRRISSPAFKRGDLTAIMGGIELDLRPAATSGDQPAVIDLFAFWGGIEITVPPDWDVSNEVFAIMGGVDDNSTGDQAARHRLILRGFVVMGGVEIKT